MKEMPPKQNNNELMKANILNTSILYEFVDDDIVLYSLFFLIQIQKSIFFIKMIWIHVCMCKKNPVSFKLDINYNSTVAHLSWVIE